MEPSRGHHLEGLPSARYAVSKTAGSRDLGGSTPSPSASGGMAELVRQRVATAQAATAARRFESCCLRQRPVAQRSRAVGFEPTCARSIRAGASIALRRLTATSFNGRTAGCYPANAGSTPAVAALQRILPRSSSGRGRRSLTPEARVRFPLGVLRHSTPSDASGDATRLSAGRGGFDSRRGRFSLAVAQW